MIPARIPQRDARLGVLRHTKRQTAARLAAKTTLASVCAAAGATASQLVESGIAEPHTLADLARSAGLSRYHFLRTFSQVTGVTPHQWILRTRLRDAANRLTATADPITDIALDVGFEDFSNFIRSFRAEFGVSPGRYRRDLSLRSG